GLALQRVAQRLQLADQLVDLLHRSPGHALEQLVDIVGDEIAVALRLAADADNVAADEFADFPFDFRLRRRVDFGGLTRLEKGHDGTPVQRPSGPNSTDPFPPENVTTSRANGVRAVAFARSCPIPKCLCWRHFLGL